MTVSDKSNLNFERTCRLCVKESSDLNPICHSKNPLHDLIKECVDIVVQAEDKLPKHVCEECLDRMQSWKSFKTTCQTSENFLLGYINKLDDSVSSNEYEADKPNSQNGSHSIQIAEDSVQEAEPSPVEGDDSSCSKQADVGNCDKPSSGEEEIVISDNEDVGCDDREGSSTDSADVIERIDITKDKPPKKETSPVIRLANAEAFKLLIDAQFLDTNRNLYRSLDSENYFACAANRVVDGQNCLLLELEKNVFCEVEFVVDGKSVSGEDSSAKKEDNETVEVETILTESENSALNLNLNGTDGVSYIIIPSENEGAATVVSEDSNSAKENKKDANASILHSILKSKGDSTSKGALMFHKYARPAAEKAVKFLIPGSSPNTGNNVSFVTPPGLTPLGYLAIPPNIQLVNQPNLIAPTGLKRSLSESEATPSKRQKVLLPAPSKPPTPKPKPRSAISRILDPMVVVPVSKPTKKLSKKVKPAAPTPSSNDAKKFGTELKTADDISQRIQQIIEANEQILQKTWGQYRKEEEEGDEEEKEEEEEVDEPESIPEQFQLQSISGARFVLKPIQNQEGKVAQKPKGNTSTESPEVLKFYSKPSPLRATPIFAVSTPAPTASLPKLPIPRLPTAYKAEPQKREKTQKSSATKSTAAKTIDDILFEGLDIGKTTEDPEIIAICEGEGENNDGPEIRYTITEEGLKEPIIIVDASGQIDWKTKIPDDQKLDPATLPKNNQKSKILQKFYLPKEPVLTDGTTSYDPSEEEDVKDVLFWADQLPDPTKDDDGIEGNYNGEIAQMAQMAGIKLRKKRKRKPHKKKPKPKIYTCHLCEGIAYAKFYEIVQHDKWFHSDLPANEYCPTCGKCFVFEDRVQWHCNIYHSVKTMFCDLCGRGFSNKERLSTHKKLHSDKYICDQCGYRAPTSRKLDEHYRRHTGEKPFMCDICGMKLASKVSVKQHLSKHTAENPENKWQCPDCEYSSASATSFYHHRKRHETISTFLCELCGQNVLTKSRLYKHMRFAHGPETVGHYVCGECNGIFHSKTACDDHLKEKHRMSGEGRSFVCKLCFKSYATKAACKKHFRTHNF